MLWAARTGYDAYNLMLIIILLLQQNTSSSVVGTQIGLKFHCGPQGKFVPIPASLADIMNIFPKQSDYRGNLFSQTFYFWLENIFCRGFRNTLTQNDLHSCPKEQSSKELYETFEKHWKVELNKKSAPDIKIALAKSLYSLELIAGLLFLIEIIILLSPGALGSGGAGGLAPPVLK